MKIMKLTAAVLLMGLLAGCSKAQPAQTTPTDDTTMAAPATAEQTEYIPSLTELAKQNGIAVETPYITLYYPKQWTQLQSAEVTQEGQQCRITFRTIVAQQEIELFSLIIGPEETEGYLLGMLDGMKVYSLMNEQNPESWSEADYEDLCRQQEYINELILQLHENAAFTKA